MLRRILFLLVVALLAITSGAVAQQSPAATSAPKAPQGVAVLSTGSTREEAFALARAIYASSLRPRALDELRARILGGDPAPPGATKDVRELAELRGSISGDDAASRRLLTSIAQQINVQALLVVSRSTAPDPTAASSTSSDAGADDSDAGPPGPGPGPASPRVVARLFLAETGDFDAARYEPDQQGGWRGTATSLSPRFPPPPAPAVGERQGAPAPKIVTEGKADNKPFYASPWLWAAVGAAVLIGGFFFFASQDTSKDPIHLQMTVPR